jgi:hypothetical protein
VVDRASSVPHVIGTCEVFSWCALAGAWCERSGKLSPPPCLLRLASGKVGYLHGGFAMSLASIIEFATGCGNYGDRTEPEKIDHLMRKVDRLSANRALRTRDRGGSRSLLGSAHGPGNVECDDLVGVSPALPSTRLPGSAAVLSRRYVKRSRY